MDPKVGWGRASGNHQRGANNVRQVHGVSHMVPACRFCVSEGLGLRKGTVASASTSVWEKAAPQLLSWCHKIQFLPICLWCLFSCCFCAGAQREWVWELPGIPEVSSIASIPTGFYREKLWHFLFLALEPWTGGRCGAGSLCSWDIPPDFYLPLVGVEPVCSVSLTLLPVMMYFLL